MSQTSEARELVAADQPDAALYINRELSWLAFNERVLEEAADPSTPLLERVKFAAIAASNLDEFFMVRVAAIKQAIDEDDVSPDLSGLTPPQQFAAVGARAHAFVDALYDLTRGQLLPALAAHNIRIAGIADLNEGRKASIAAMFRDGVLPVLTPLAIDISRPFPLLSSLSLNLALVLEPGAGDTMPRLAIVQVPAGLTRLVRIAETGGVTFVLLEEIIRAHLAQLCPGQAIRESAVIRLARDAELEFDDEGGRTHLEMVEREVKRRRRSEVIRLEIEASASDELRRVLMDQLDLAADDLYAVPGPIDLR